MKYLPTILACICLFLFACDDTPQRESVYDPVPWFSMTETDLIQKKGGDVEKGFSNDKNGTLLAHLAYQEPWFDLPCKAAYLINDVDKKILQINLTFKKGKAEREKILSGISNFIGEPEAQGAAGNNAPSNYFAYWQRVGYTGVYQELSDRTELYFIPVIDELDKALPVETPQKDESSDDQADSLSSK